MTSIHPLPPNIVQRIAAGEVIDAPRAALRELAENALDAKADRISIAISTEGDIFSLEVCDNGEGMALEDLIQAALPHSTSKIACDQDLESIQSLGFRGEALHSIARFGQLEVCSRPPHSEGYQVKFNSTGFPDSPPRRCAMAPGTIVRVKHLFGENAHRARALPDRSQQLRQLQQQIYALSLAHPAVTWQITLESRPWFVLWGGNGVASLLSQMLSNVTEPDFVQGSWEGGTVTLGLPDRVSRRRSDWLKVAINGRVIHFPELEHSLLKGFSRSLPRHRYPIGIAHLQVPSHRIDWNCHPAKSVVYLQQLSHWQGQVEQWTKELLHTPQVPLVSRAQQLLRTAEPGVPYQTPALLPLRILGQLHRTYILIEQESGIWLVEQHVLHERILFEQMEQDWQIVPLSQPLLIANLSATALENLQLAGIEIEEFGDRMWSVRTLPRLLVGHPEPLQALRELSQENQAAAIWARVACLSAIRNGTVLEMAEMETMIRQWQCSANPHTCPHGRPIYLHLGGQQLAQFFRRR